MSQDQIFPYSVFNSLWDSNSPFVRPRPQSISTNQNPAFSAPFGRNNVNRNQPTNPADESLMAINKDYYPSFPPE